jgi:hypothetical protein
MQDSLQALGSVLAVAEAAQGVGHRGLEAAGPGPPGVKL